MSMRLASTSPSLIPIMCGGNSLPTAGSFDLVKAYRVSRAFGEAAEARKIVVGRDCRNSSNAYAEAVIEGLTASGTDVIDLGVCGSEEMCFATMHHDACGGIELTDLEEAGGGLGMKMVRNTANQLNHEREMSTIRRLSKSGTFRADRREGRVMKAHSTRQAYVRRILSFIDVGQLQPLKILVNAGKGAAGPAFDAIAEELAAQGAPLRFVRMHHAPDHSFPDDFRDPLLDRNREATSRAVVKADADFGVAWDSDFERCLFFDHEGRCIPGQYLTGLLAQAVLTKQPGAMVLIDSRALWCGSSMVARAGGRPETTASDISNLKLALHRTNAAFGGDMSGRHCFRDFMSSESGMISFLLIAELVSRKRARLADLVEEAWARVPSSGEISLPTTNPEAVMRRVGNTLRNQAISINWQSGLAMTFKDWRLSMHSSKDRTAIKFGIEALGNASLLVDRVAYVASLIQAN